MNKASCLSLLSNAVPVWNTVHIARIVDQLRAAGHEAATDKGALASILTVSRANNMRYGVTGALLYSDGCFAQILEGELDAVQQTFERIQNDMRHGAVVVLEAKPVETRMFGLWEMALAEPAAPAKA